MKQTTASRPASAGLFAPIIFPSLFLALVLIFFFSSTSQAQDGFFSSGTERIPSLTIATPEIALDVPMPVQANSLTLLLAQNNGGVSLSDLKANAVRKFSDHLLHTLGSVLREHFADEEVPLVESRGFLTLHTFLDIAVGKQLKDLRNSADYELERGTVELAGDFHYRLENLNGIVLQEERIDIAKLRVKENYRVKTPHNGEEMQDTSDAAIEQALTNAVERILDRIEDDLEADELQELVEQ